MERFEMKVNGWKLLTIITKRSILDVAAVLDPPLSLRLEQRKATKILHIFLVIEGIGQKFW